MFSVHRWGTDFKVRNASGIFEGSDTGTDGFYGVGLAINIGDEWQATGEWERYEFDNGDVASISIGFNYRL